MENAAQSAAQRMRLGFMAMLARARTDLRWPRLQPAPIADRLPNNDGEPQTPEQWLALRNALARDWQAAQLRRDTRAMHALEADLKAATMAILDKER